MYDFVRWQLIWVAFIVFFAGLVYQTIQFFALTTEKDPVFLNLKMESKESHEGRWARRIAAWLASAKRTIWGSYPVVTVMTSIFHACLILTPILLMGHNILLDESWGLSFWSFSEFTTDALTVIFLICAVFFLLRRVFLRRVRVITTAYDYLVLAIAIAPFVTGFLAYHQWFHYRTVMILHILAGEVMLMAIPFTKLGHMLFFFFYRFFIGSEYSFVQGTRSW